MPAVRPDEIFGLDVGAELSFEMLKTRVPRDEAGLHDAGEMRLTVASFPSQVRAFTLKSRLYSPDHREFPGAANANSVRTFAASREKKHDIS